MGVKELVDLAVKAAEVIKKQAGHIVVVSHYDADGICSGALMYKALELCHKSYEVCFVRQLERRVLQDLAANKPADLYVFVELGSGQLEAIREHIKKPVLIIDHHQPTDVAWPELHHCNAFFAGVDGKDEISGAGMAYLVARALSTKMHEHVDLAIIGATGDQQQQFDGKYKGVNKILLDDALAHKIVFHEKGLRLFGRYTRPLHKALEYWDEPILPEISGSESGAVQFLSELGIPLTDTSGNWRTLANLSRSEERRLATALILEGLAAGNGHTSLVGDVYRLRNDHEVREFATILNACGRLNKPVEGMRLALGEKTASKDILAEYKRKVARYLAWLRKHKSRGLVTETQHAAYIVARNGINENFIGTVTSMAVRSLFNKAAIFGFANSSDGLVKVSARAKKLLPELNLGKAIRAAAEAVGGEGGGHMGAAGAKIPRGTEKSFIEVVDRLLFSQAEPPKAAQ